MPRGFTSCIIFQQLVFVSRHVIHRLNMPMSVPTMNRAVLLLTIGPRFSAPLLRIYVVGLNGMLSLKGLILCRHTVQFRHRMNIHLPIVPVDTHGCQQLPWNKQCAAHYRPMLCFGPPLSGMYNKYVWMECWVLEVMGESIVFPHFSPLSLIFLILFWG